MPVAGATIEELKTPWSVFVGLEEVIHTSNDTKRTMQANIWTFRSKAAVDELVKLSA